MREKIMKVKLNKTSLSENEANVFMKGLDLSGISYTVIPEAESHILIVWAEIEANESQATLSMRPIHGCIGVIASSMEEANDIVLNALSAHPKINPDWFEGELIESE
jgi:hypothetical protein